MDVLRNDVGAARDAALAVATGFAVVDLTMTLSPQTAYWPGDPPMTCTEVATFAVDGCHTRSISLGEHAGTHLDAPDHFVPDGLAVDRIPAEHLVVAARVIDFTGPPRQDPNAALQPADVAEHERRYGTIASGSAVLLHTGWSARRHDQLAYAGSKDPEGHGELAFPGFGVAAAQLLVRRGVIGLGVDTLGIDPGNRPDFPVHAQVSLPHGLWHLENLCRLDEVPPTGAVAIAGVPKVADASGFPTRALALVPRR